MDRAVRGLLRGLRRARTGQRGQGDRRRISRERIELRRAYEDVSVLKNWIGSVARDAADAGGYPVASWVPEAEDGGPPSTVDAGAPDSGGSGLLSETSAPKSHGQGCSVHAPAGTTRTASIGWVALVAALVARRRRWPWARS